MLEMQLELLDLLYVLAAALLGTLGIGYRRSKQRKAQPWHFFTIWTRTLRCLLLGHTALMVNGESVALPVPMGDGALREKEGDPDTLVRPIPVLLVCKRCGVTFWPGHVGAQEEKVKKPRVPQAKKGNKGGKK